MPRQRRSASAAAAVEKKKKTQAASNKKKIPIAKPSSQRTAPKAPALRVLYVGNSFTTRHSLPELIRARLAELRPELFDPASPAAVLLEQRLSCSGGASLAQRVNDKNGSFGQLLQDFCPQVVVLQEQSSKPWKSPEKFKQAARDLFEKLTTHTKIGPNVQVLMYQTTPWESCSPAQETELFESYRAIAAELATANEANHTGASDSVSSAKPKKPRKQVSRNRADPAPTMGTRERQCVLVPVGDAWCSLRKNVASCGSASRTKRGSSQAKSSRSKKGPKKRKASALDEVAHDSDLFSAGLCEGMRQLASRSLWDKDGKHPGIVTAHLAADVFARVVLHSVLHEPLKEIGSPAASASTATGGGGKKALSAEELRVLHAIGRATVTTTIGE
eukprot:INCI11349.1.p1 GENE.INCI11349.1~~INCI11349.1.p1  ORF type:complete len:389 (-),score=72.34 INCI11349.1:945-2111(-)